jgi:uncharacterized peroxidase-related enzyme
MSLLVWWGAKVFHIIIVDDDKAIADGLAMMLEMLGYSADPVYSVRNALTKINADNPHAVFLDINMPGVSGLEVATYLRRDPETAHIAIIILSADGTPETQAEALEAGAHAYLVKPATSAAIQEALTVALEKAAVNTRPKSNPPQTTQRKKPMARFPIKEYEELNDPKVKAIYDEIKAELGFGIVPNLFKSMATFPAFLEANWKQFKGTILEGDMPRTLKEMVGVAISQANKSDYALKVHLHGLSALGISEEVLQKLVSDFDACPLPQREKAVIAFGLKAGIRPHDITDGDFEHLRDLGLDDGEIFEIIGAANLFVGVNQYTDSIALEIDKL